MGDWEEAMEWAEREQNEELEKIEEEGFEQVEESNSINSET